MVKKLLIKNPTEEEKDIILSCNTPEKVIDYIRKSLSYDKQDNYPKKLKTNRSFRRVIRDKRVHCLEGVLFAAAILREHGYPPLLSCIEAFHDWDHNVFLYKSVRKYGSIAASRQTELWERSPIYKNLKDLMLSYYPVYYNEEGEFTMCGFSEIFDLRKYDEQGVDWITAEENLDFIENDLYKLVYQKLFPVNGRIYYKNTTGNKVVFIDDIGKAKFKF